MGGCGRRTHGGLRGPDRRTHGGLRGPDLMENEEGGNRSGSHSPGGQVFLYRPSSGRAHPSGDGTGI